jgi:hypothetical protein
MGVRGNSSNEARRRAASQTKALGRERERRGAKCDGRSEAGRGVAGFLTPSPRFFFYLARVTSSKNARPPSSVI